MAKEISSASVNVTTLAPSADADHTYSIVLSALPMREGNLIQLTYPNGFDLTSAAIIGGAFAIYTAGTDANNLCLQLEGDNFDVFSFEVHHIINPPAKSSYIIDVRIHVYSNNHQDYKVSQKALNYPSMEVLINGI